MITKDVIENSTKDIIENSTKDIFVTPKLFVVMFLAIVIVYDVIVTLATYHEPQMAG